MKRLKRLLRPTQAPTQGSPSAAPAPALEHPQGLNVLSEGTDPIVDIVAIHGLNGHREKTWTAENGIHWLRDLLPDDAPRARILSWGYDANTHAASGTSSLFLYDHARTLVADLSRKRKLTNSSQRPIIFIAHSLGGIVVKSALIHSDAARQGALLDQRSVKLSTYGILFMGTPHQGGNGVQLGRVLANVASVFVATDDRLFKHLERDSEWLLQQLGQYGPISGEFVTKFAYEEYPTSIAPGKRILVVPRASAVVPGQADAEPIVIHADHKNMVKFLSKQDVGYATVSEHLQIMMVDAEGIIRSRWEAESRADNARGNGMQFSLPFSLSEVNEVSHFVARKEELALMQEILTTCRNPVFWMNATDEATLKQSFLKAAERILRENPSVTYLERAVTRQDMDETVKAVKRWLSERSNNHWLIIYDNYDHPLLGGNARMDAHIHNAESQSTSRRNSLQKDGTVLQAFDIRPFFPETHHGAIIVTTRLSTVKLGQTIRLSKLKRIEDSLQILESTSNRERLGEDPAAVHLAEKLDGLPLALSTAGAYLDQVSMTCAEYVELYQESWKRLQKSSPQVLPYEDRAMYSTWNISYMNVEKRNKSSAMLLKLWAYFDHNDLWYDLLCGANELAPPWLQSLADKLAFMESIHLLCDHGLVEANSSTKENGAGSPGYSVHGCVHDWMINVLHEQIDVDMVQLAVRCVASLVPSREDGEYWRVQQRLLQHADRCLELMAKGVKIQSSEFWTNVAFGNLYADQGRLDKAEAMYDRALQGYEKALGPEHTSTLDTVNNLGLLYERQGRLDEAEAMFDRALQGYQKALGSEYTSTLDTVNNLGNLYRSQGRLNESEAMFDRALQGYEKILGPEHTSTLGTVNNLGLLYDDQGRLNEAEAIYERALQGKEKVLGSEHTSTLNTVNNLGLFYERQGRLDEAEAMFDRALQGYEKTLGPEHTSTLDTVNNLGNFYRIQGRLNEAEAMFERALQGKEKALEPIIFKTYVPALNTLKSFSILYQQRHKPGFAQQCYRRAQDGLRAVFGDDSRRVRTISERLKEVSA
ncbi:Nephrocystin-3 [Fusarium oxysporum f. sp. raphani]|uniref:Nephrocystin-3 n=1 Tax=Fusarium oxysporum f. sp. raphani TaxID=96318 RepID=A0A8J5NKP4_FUSOX|nr:Nephrocystin-3 [Fusarium oxysporum f. sp. raphani]